MALTLEDILQSLQGTRAYFLKHIDGLTEAQWEWKPYEGCKSVRETIAHLVADELTFVESLKSGKEPDYAAHDHLYGRTRHELLALLDQAYQSRLATIREMYSDAPLDQEICVWGWTMKLAPGLMFFSSEDSYHAGQVAFIRMATDPSWDYYAAVFG